MPGRIYLASGVQDIAKFLSADIPPQSPRYNIAPGQEVLTLTPDGAQMMRWGIIPVGRKNARGRPVMETIVNARSETVFDKSAFEGVGRAVVPVNGWYEWTGEKRRKTAWRIRPKSGGLLGFAAIYDIWAGPGGLRVPQVATVTCAPNKDVEKIHHRMGVILPPEDIQTWLSPDLEAASALMRPWPEGLLEIESADDVDWSAA